MVAFGFIENFFFISLALVFVLVLLLVYHFKNRISVAEKKSDSMYGLLTAVVKEIKTLRGMFGVGTTSEPSGEQPANFILQSKTLPEVNVSAVTTPANNFASFAQSKNPDESKSSVASSPVASNPVANASALKEVINLDFSAADNKIVVSDSDSDSESESESDSESDTSLDSDSDSDSEEEEEVLHIEDAIDITQILNLENQEEIEVSLVTDNQIDVYSVEESVSTPLEESVSAPLEESVSAPLEEFANKPSIDQLRKMNINQLKTIASQLGISTDISKMKKPELISLIRGKDV